MAGFVEQTLRRRRDSPILRGSLSPFRNGSSGFSAISLTSLSLSSSTGRVKLPLCPVSPSSGCVGRGPSALEQRWSCCRRTGGIAARSARSRERCSRQHLCARTRTPVNRILDLRSREKLSPDRLSQGLSQRPEEWGGNKGRRPGVRESQGDRGGRASEEVSASAAWGCVDGSRRGAAAGTGQS